jgi:SAM-dependent methyltransferase
MEANAEALPFGDDAFDAVLSCIGVMFAPHHQRSADELIRVCRPGGVIGLISWTPSGFVGQMFATMKPYVASPPPGAQPPPLWGDEDHVRGLLSDRVTDFTARREMLPVSAFGDGAAFRDFFKANYGPMVAAYRGIAGEPGRVAALDAELAALGDRHLAGGETMQWEYLVVTARKR